MQPTEQIDRPAAAAVNAGPQIPGNHLVPPFVVQAWLRVVLTGRILRDGIGLRAVAKTGFTVAGDAVEVLRQIQRPAAGDRIRSRLGTLRCRRDQGRFLLRRNPPLRDRIDGAVERFRQLRAVRGLEEDVPNLRQRFAALLAISDGLVRVVLLQADDELVLHLTPHRQPQHVFDQRLVLVRRQQLERRHVGAGDAFINGAGQILPRGTIGRLGRCELENAATEVARPRVQIRGRRAVGVSAHPVTVDAMFGIQHAAGLQHLAGPQCDPISSRRSFNEARRLKRDRIAFADGFDEDRLIRLLQQFARQERDFVTRLDRQVLFRERDGHRRRGGAFVDRPGGGVQLQREFLPGDEIRWTAEVLGERLVDVLLRFRHQVVVVLPMGELGVMPDAPGGKHQCRHGTTRQSAQRELCCRGCRFRI